MSGWENVDPAEADTYPPNIQAILKSPSPASVHLGLELVAIDRAADAARVAFNAHQGLCNKWGALQGGMVAAMLDELMSIAAGLSLEWGQIVPTLEMKTSFLSPAPPARLIGEGRVVKRGASVVFIEAALEGPGGVLLATASGTARVVTQK